MRTLRCKLCNQLGHTVESCPLAKKIREFSPRISYSFSGSSPPEIFVGRYNYPKVFAGIIAPNEYGETERYSIPEYWFRENASIEQIINYRARMIYSRFNVNVKSLSFEKKINVMQEIALASKHVDLSFELASKPSEYMLIHSFWPFIGNPARLKSVTLESNPKVERKVEYLTADTDVKADEAIIELYQAGIKISNIIKVLSAGMLGLKLQRKLVPTRWAVTACDAIISNQLIEKIKGYAQLSSFLLFHSEYLGNHYEIILMPSCWSFEVIEAKMPECVWNKREQIFFAQDYENYFGRKDYAKNVTGAYYANRLAIVEYLEKIKRQAAALILREVRPEYNFPCGVGILREATRAAFTKKPEEFSCFEDAIKAAQQRLKLPIEKFIKNSRLIKEFKAQKNLLQYL